jgi:hypothetical protein
MSTLSKPKRGVCTSCGNRVQTEPVLTQVYERFMGIRHWFAYRLLLCPPDRQAFLDQVHAGVCQNPVDIGGELASPGRWRGGPQRAPGSLPETAPLADDPVKLSASWPRSSRPSAIGERRSRLWA